MLNTEDMQALGLSLQLAAISTGLLMVMGTPLAWFLAHSRRKWVSIIEAMVTLPLVLPPTVIGFYLLVCLSPNNWLGALLGDANPVFSFSGLVIGSLLYSLPFVVQPLQQAFTAIGSHPLQVAATLGASPWDRFCSVALPLAWPGYLTATVLGFAHTLGEFGVILMIGGNIPGETRVAAIAIYDHVENLAYGQAHRLAAVLVIISLAMLIPLYLFAKSKRQR